MTDPVSDLLGTIREEINLYREIVENARHKTALLVQGNLDAILESNKIEETFNSSSRILQLERKRLCDDLSRIFRIPCEEFTLVKLADHLEESLAQELRSQANLFSDILKQLKLISRRNMKLAEKSIQYSRGLLELISNASGAYRPNGLFEQIPSIQPSFSQRA